MRNRVAKAVLLSLAAHAVAWVAGLARIADQDAPVARFAAPRIVGVVIEIPESGPGAGGGDARESSGAPVRGSRLARAAGLRGFGIPLPTAGNGRATQARPSVGWNANEPGGDGLYAYLYRRVDESLSFPGELAHEWITGTVSATLRFSREGEYLADRLEIDSGSRYLALAARRQLRKAFADPLSPSFTQRIPPEGIRFAITVNYSISGSQVAVDAAVRAQARLGSQAIFHRVFRPAPFPLSLGLANQTPALFLDLGSAAERLGGALRSLVRPARSSALQKYRDDPEF